MCMLDTMKRSLQEKMYLKYCLDWKIYKVGYTHLSLKSFAYTFFFSFGCGPKNLVLSSTHKKIENQIYHFKYD